MILAIASGKGGTGKTTLAVNLARVVDSPVQLLDCDVEEPNCHLFLNLETKGSEGVNILVPEVDQNLCDGCGKCAEFCQYGAIAVPKESPLVFPELCHGCGGCRMVCPRGAIKEVEKPIGTVETAHANHIELVQGSLDIGRAMAPPVIRKVKEKICAEKTVIVDAPPGTSCPVIAAIRGADVVILVTEPTPFGLHDLELAVEMIKELDLPFGVVVNRVGTGDGRVHSYCSKLGIPILLNLPDDRQIAEAYSRGEVIVDSLPQYRSLFKTLLENVTDGNGPFRSKTVS